MKINTVKTVFFVFLLAAGSCLTAPAGAEAANWFQLQGTEKPQAKPVNLWGFIQPTYFQSQDKVDPSDDFRKDDFNIRRARLGIRGVVPKTDAKINYFLLSEFGRNGITENPNGGQSNAVALTDASITLNYLTGIRLRFGQFKIPIGTDGLQAIHVHKYIEFSDVFDQLMLERFGKDRSVGAYRDIGVQAFNWWRFGKQNKYELAYALMIANGNGINSQDNDKNKDLLGKLTFSRIFNNSKGPRRQELEVGAWFISGKRTGYAFAGGANGNKIEQNRKRYGLEFNYNKDFGHRGAGHLVAEAVWGDGWVYAPKFLGGAVPAAKRFFTENTSVAGHGVPHADLNAFGWYVDFGYRPPVLSKKLEFDLRYSLYDPDNGNDLAKDVSQKTLTLGLQYFFTPRVRATVNYDFRDNDWNKKVEDRVMAQLTIIFK
ncbi:phosphate-selective porin O and P [bacterium BMS3Abin13]|nr:phosphate-selective porin O and P [bacterium BMS3Abin13]